VVHVGDDGDVANRLFFRRHSSATFALPYPQHVSPRLD
jgi:hypothetical protein